MNPAIRTEEVRPDPGLCLGVTPSAFEVFYMVDLAGKFSGNEVLIKRLEEAVPSFYEQAGQRLRAWVALPPKIKRGVPAGPRGDEGRDRIRVKEQGVGGQKSLDDKQVSIDTNGTRNPDNMDEEI